MPSTVWSGTQNISVSAGEATVVPIRMPYRGVLRAYSLVQTSGANVGAAAKLLSSNQETEPNSLYPEGAFLVTSFSLDNGQNAVIEQDVNLAYQNKDGDPSNGQRFLYLKLTPAGTGEVTFVFSVTVETPILR
jgi:hypothetical protein